MRFLIAFLLLFSGFSSTGQIRYVPIFIDQCISDLSEWSYWYVTDSLGNQYDPNISDEEVILPRLGNYYLHTDLYHSIPLDLIPIEVQDTITRDTFYTEILSYQSKAVGLEGHYYSCDSIADGYLVDYYSNGNIRKEGNFTEGKVRDSFKIYYRTGELEALTIAKDSAQKIYYQFYKNGQIAHQADYTYSVGYIYEYYPDGTLSYVEDWKKNTTKSYYPTGQLKTKKTAEKRWLYYPNGQLKERQHLWKSMSIKMQGFESDNKFIRWTIPCYKWTQFDKNGSKLLTIYYEREGYEDFAIDLEQLFKRESLFTINKAKLHQSNQKIEYIYDEESSTFVFILYQKEGLCWIKQKTMNRREVLLLLQQYPDNL